MDSLDRFAKAKLDQLKIRSLRRRLTPTDRRAFPYVDHEGERLISFSCNDYLGLSQHPTVKAAAAAAIETYGVGAGASRLVTGDSPLYAALESRLAEAKGTEAACVFGSGYLANIGVLGALAGPDDLILIDELAHACLNAGAKLSGARTLRFRHNDVGYASELLDAHRAQCRHALLVTETVFSMDGDRAPLSELAALCALHDAWLLTDDAHGFAVTPSKGAIGDLQMGTLSKALGSYGGYLCASANVVDLVATRARSLIYSTGLPAGCLAAALAALDVIDAELELVAAPLAKAQRFTSALGLPLAQSSIVPLVLGEPDAALDASVALRSAGFLVTAIRPPTVPHGTARLRFAFSALHDDATIDRLAETVASLPGHASSRSPFLAVSVCPASS